MFELGKMEESTSLPKSEYMQMLGWEVTGIIIVADREREIYCWSFTVSGQLYRTAAVASMVLL